MFSHGDVLILKEVMNFNSKTKYVYKNHNEQTKIKILFDNSL